MDLKKTRKQSIVLVSLLVFLSAVFFVRSFYGFDWTDESYYSALTNRFLNGDRMFVDAWEIHQLGALITLPFIAVYKWFHHGSADGVILFMRMVYGIGQLLSGFYLFRVVGKRHTPATGFACGAVWICFTPFCISSYSYNTQSLLFLLLSALLLLCTGGAIVSLCCFFAACFCCVFYPAIPKEKKGEQQAIQFSFLERRRNACGSVVCAVCGS